MMSILICLFNNEQEQVLKQYQQMNIQNTKINTNI